ncbi:MAG: hypothetical protein R2749_30620 [Acidimicrobiales bacterium]
MLLATGGSHACAVSSIYASDYIFCWGADDAGQLGDGPIVHAPPMVPIVGPSGSRPDFVFVGGAGSGVVALAAGATHTCAVLADGDVWCWGGNARGQLGDGTTTDGVYPVQVVGGLDTVAIDGGGAHLRGGPGRCGLVLGGERPRPAGRRHHHRSPGAHGRDRHRRRHRRRHR